MKDLAKAIGITALWTFIIVGCYAACNRNRHIHQFGRWETQEGRTWTYYLRRTDAIATQMQYRTCTNCGLVEARIIEP